MESMSFIYEDVEANQTIISEEEVRNPLDWNRLKNSNDDYDEILFNADRQILLRNGEYVLAVPEPHEVIRDEPSEDDVRHDEQEII